MSSDRTAAPDGALTQLLQRWAAGDEEARDPLFARIYPELQRLAEARARRGGFQLSLQATELVHEAYLRLVQQRQADWQNRAHFFAIASTVLRRVLVDLVKLRSRKKRIPAGELLPLDNVHLPAPAADVDLLALDEALDALSEVQPMAARIVELRFFCGLNVPETAQVLSLSEASVSRKWRFARAWLAQRLGAEA